MSLSGVSVRVFGVCSGRSEADRASETGRFLDYIPWEGIHYYPISTTNRRECCDAP